MRLPMAWGAALIAAPLAATVAASSLFVTANQWWRHPYFAEHGRWAWAWWEYALGPGTLSPFMKLMLGATGLGGAAAGFIVARLTTARARRSTLYGEARWQTLLGAIRAGVRFSLKPPRDAILLGIKWLGPIRLYASLPGEAHVSLTARTGAGKGVSFVVPNALNWGGPLFCFSVKRDVLLEAAAERERMGDQVYVFDVTDPNGETHCWSGLGEVRCGTPDVYDDIQRAMWSLIPETRANNPYWDNAARMVATAVGVMLAETPDTQLSVGAILRVIEAADYESRLRTMIDQAQLECRPFPAAAVNTVLSWLDNKAEEAAAAVRANIVTALSLWHVPRVDAATSRSDFGLSTIRQQRISVFVCAQPGDIRRLRPIYGLLFTQFVQMNSRVDYRHLRDRNPIRTLCLLDEFWALGEMKELADALAFLRSFGLRFAVVLQTKDQIKRSFGEEGARNLFNNTGAELIFGGADQETAKEVSERSGTDTVEEASTSKPKFNWFNFSRHSENRAHKQRALLLPQEVSRLPGDVVVVQMPGQPPLKLKRLFWFNDPAFRDRQGEPPPMPKLHVEMERDAGSVMD